MYTKFEPKKISYKFIQFLQDVSIFISVKFTLTGEYRLHYVGLTYLFSELFFTKKII